MEDHILVGFTGKKDLNPRDISLSEDIVLNLIAIDVSDLKYYIKFKNNKISDENENISYNWKPQKERE